MLINSVYVPQIYQKSGETQLQKNMLFVVKMESKG